MQKRKRSSRSLSSKIQQEEILPDERVVYFLLHRVFADILGNGSMARSRMGTLAPGKQLKV
jgi:hypothetical protein